MNEKDLGYTDRRPDRQAGRQQQAVLLLRARVRAAHRGRRHRAVPLPDRARAGRRFLADARQQRQPVSVHQGSAAARHRARAANTAGCFQSTAACVGRIPADRLYQTGSEHPEDVSDAEHRRPRRRLQLRAGPRPSREAARAISRRSGSTISRSQKLRGTFKFSGWSQQDVTIPGTIPGWNDTRAVQPVRRARWRPR